jgi:hypothetical protein
MPPDPCNLERRLTPKADPDDRQSWWKVRYTRFDIGAVQANGPALLGDPERVPRVLVVDGFALERMLLPIAEHHHALLEVDVSRDANVQAQALLEPPSNTKRLGRFDGPPFARQRDWARHRLLDGARQPSKDQDGRHEPPGSGPRGRGAYASWTHSRENSTLPPPLSTREAVRPID